ncbi:hypothetical protein PsYK624_162820 [Phanerochaete sordida]|uniref:Uncharacterized protein n=1 Tax=Phanerochaete sordida TaxID=48140 RepID=A0A9P3GT27_9APHY|nr:hypothetical protein PsYK624_162820 [Phanerochaete sordida]
MSALSSLTDILRPVPHTPSVAPAATFAIGLRGVLSDPATRMHDSMWWRGFNSSCVRPTGLAPYVNAIRLVNVAMSVATTVADDVSILPISSLAECTRQRRKARPRCFATMSRPVLSSERSSSIPYGWHALVPERRYCDTLLRVPRTK